MLAATLLLVTLALPSAASAASFLGFGTGSPGGVYFPLGGAMADLWNRYLPDVNVTAESTAASVENSRLVGNGDADLGMVLGSVAYRAYKGEEPFEKPLPLRALFQMYPAPEHIVTLKGTGITSARDLAGRRVSTEAPGSGAETIALMILKAYGIDPDSGMRRARLSQTESTGALRDGVIDAAFFNFAYPASAVTELATTRDVELVSLEPDMLEKLLEVNPFMVPVTVPAGTYTGVDHDTLALGDSNLVVVNADMPEELAYQLVKTLYEHASELFDVHPVAHQLVPENGVNTPIPLHPGAERFFREVGALHD
ncbi:TRAP transporter [Limnochorda pilosa]|uniref:TRAP transporter n=1 Tax=Limnochorda pilosa TaxID=1555112 RepID=A0A0K2SHJ9_LIMPI|nr:TRAP transporter [Limnochorda pilosa]